ncbi:hypothetical protein C7212DRAFT_348621 [Tuber magnatum]|uniref:Amidoligase enzyme n=1 Tax=Tuber magnatum TaxID=42249 RepID=A0A317SBC5_9PEZI|nr:hypothetical protein C7212DRAFT_348621 [Tuber magnatum]
MQRKEVIRAREECTRGTGSGNFIDGHHLPDVIPRGNPMDTPSSNIVGRPLFHEGIDMDKYPPFPEPRVPGGAGESAAKGAAGSGWSREPVQTSHPFPLPESGGESGARPTVSRTSLTPYDTPQGESPWPPPTHGMFNRDDFHKELHSWTEKEPNRIPNGVFADTFAPRNENSVPRAHNPNPASVVPSLVPTSPPSFPGRNPADLITVGIELGFVLLNVESIYQAMELATAQCMKHEMGVCDECEVQNARGPYYKIWTDETICGETELGTGQPLGASTPVLYNTSWKQVIPEMIHILRCCGTLAFNTTTTLHVHIGIQREYRKLEIRRICRGIIVFEEEIDKLHHPTRVPPRGDRCSFYQTCRYNDVFNSMNTLQALEHLDSQPTVPRLVKCVNPPTRSSAYGRGYKYTFSSLWAYRTIEFRQGRATDDPEEILQWIGTVTKFVEACMNTRREEYLRMAGPSGITGDDLVRFGIRPAPIARPSSTTLAARSGETAAQDGQTRDTGKVNKGHKRKLAGGVSEETGAKGR